MSAHQYDIEPFSNLSVLGINIGPRPFKDLPGRLAALVEAGFEYAYLGDVYFARTEGGLPEVKRAVAESGLKVSSAHFGPMYPGPKDTLEGMKERHRRDLDTAAELGLRHVTTHYVWITGSDDPSFVSPELFAAQAYSSVQGSPAVWEDAIRKLGGREGFLKKNNDLYRWFCDEAGRRGIMPTIETATCQFSRTPAQIIEIIKEIGSPNLGICLDSGHSHAMGVNVAEAVRQAGSYLVETHFHDNFGDLDLHRPVGIGTIHWPEVILALREINFPGPVTFEMGGVSGHSHEEELHMYVRNWRELLHTTADIEARHKAFTGKVTW